MSHVTMRILFVFSCVTWDLFTNFMKFHMISGCGPWKQSSEVVYRTVGERTSLVLISAPASLQRVTFYAVLSTRKAWSHHPNSMLEWNVKITGSGTVPGNCSERLRGWPEGNWTLVNSPRALRLSQPPSDSCLKSEPSVLHNWFFSSYKTCRSCTKFFPHETCVSF